MGVVVVELIIGVVVVVVVVEGAVPIIQVKLKLV